MDQYISNILFILNGKEIDDFNTFEEDARVIRKEVKLMGKTGVMGVSPSYGFTLGYVIPANKPEVDFEGVEDGTAIIEMENGSRITFTGVNTIEIGSTKFDGEKEATKDIKFVAGKRIKE